MNLDFSFLLDIGNRPFYEIMWYFFAKAGWIPFVIIFIWMVIMLNIKARQIKYARGLSWILLAIDVPKRNEQTLKAVENIFAQIAGAHGALNWVDKYIKGKGQPLFSLEIVTIDGYIQFLIRTQAGFRDLIEAAIFAQYSDAEITEVADYAKAMEMKFPNEKYDMWGADLVLAAKSYYPIRSYIEFEDSLTQEFKDPLAALLEIYSKFRKGEQGWLQIMISPTGTEWIEDGVEKINDFMGIKKVVKPSMLNTVAEFPLKGLDVINAALGFGKGEEKKEERKQMMFVPPLEKAKIDGIQRKIAKIGFTAKMRMVYIGKKEVFSKQRGVSGVFGAIKQFNTLDLNAFKPDKIQKTDAKFVLVKQRLAKKQNTIFSRYIKRDTDGAPCYILNIEELATVFHFPTDYVKAALVKKTESKKAEPPMGLPIVDDIKQELPNEMDKMETVVKPEPKKDFSKKIKSKENIKEPAFADASTFAKASVDMTDGETEEVIYKTAKTAPLPGIDFETDYFEKKFALKNSVTKKALPTPNVINEEMAEGANEIEEDDSVPPNLPIAS